MSLVLKSYSKYVCRIESILAHRSISEVEVLVSCKNWVGIEAIDQGLIRVLDMIDVSPD